MVEDSTALLGIAIAAIGIYLSDVTNKMIYDAFAISIGAVLMFLHSFWQEAMSKKDHVKIIQSVSKIPEANRVITLRTMHFGPNDVLVAMEGVS